jgi:hypothetical protein
VALALDPKPDLAFAPPDHATQPEMGAEQLSSLPEIQLQAATSTPASAEPASTRCTQCKGLLPSGRTVNFCPHCGRSQALTHCPVCESELEAGWRHCVTCGYHIGNG